MESSKKATSLYQKELKNSLIGIGVIPVLLITVLFYNIFFYFGYQVIKKNNVRESKMVANEVVGKFSLIAEQCQSLSKDINIERLETSSSYKIKVYESLYKAANIQNLKSLFSVIDMEGNVLATNWIEIPDDNHKNAVWYLKKRLKGIGSEDSSLMYPNKQSLENDRVFYNIANPIYGENGELKGFIIFNLLENQFRQLINNVHYTDIVITNQYGHSILTSNEMLLTQSGKLNIIESDQYVMHKTGVIKGTIEVNSLIYIGLFKSIYKIGLIALFSVFVLITIGTIGFANYIARKKMVSIEHLLNMIDAAKQGVFNKEVHFNKEDEFYIIGNYLQRLLKDIDTLLKKNKESIERTAQAEIKQLELQINPHFLFNTLENIKYMIKINPEKAESLIIILSQLMRYSINNKVQFNKVGSDTRYLCDYLALQKMRFGDKLDYNLKVEEKAIDYLIPKLIVQPLIENAIKYGYQTKEYLKIDAVIKSTNNNIYIIIRDNGEGIEKEILKKIQKSLSQENNVSDHIGIYNVHRRIQLLYGENYGVKIFSEEGEGTLIIVRIPIVKGVIK